MHFASVFIRVLSLLTVGALAGLVNFLPVLPFDNKPVPGGSPFYQCDVSEKQYLEISTVDLAPNPPVRGKNLTISAVGKLHETIQQGAYVDVEVRLGYIKLLTQTYDLCETLEENNVDGLTCPLTAGLYNVVKEVEIPAEVPPGKYVVLARAYNVDDELITCLTGEIVFPAVDRGIRRKVLDKLHW
ncbi:hypothetical protein HG536_0G02450 [Torulaspora globosa]|uniref:Phosphatidylglycerol/phosphatidylinositol transfer protein n=1 Tax=Torulaspora globosa TaxID=48254 RepID=A0A7G3ZLJ8_9SACH|nr:uncharacterized protein HG536_0G02450 [Torulaspora globosa]QLL34384.1 hypothetical protein HG536_0G02450 [Torulaspora globosa]